MFGEKALPYALTFMVATAVYHFSLGVAVLKRENLKEAVVSSLKIPLLPALILSFLLKSISIPPGIEKVVQLTGNATLPLMLVSIGINLSKTPLKELKTGILGTVARFFGGTAAALIVVGIFPFSTLEKKVLIVQSSLPSAVLNFVLCEKFKKSPQTAATIIFVSTLLFPFYLFFLQKLLQSL